MTHNDKYILEPSTWATQYADELYSYAFSKTGREPLAQDLVQDTFFAALKALHGFKAQSSERTWLFAILKNKIADYYRKASSRYESTSLEQDDEHDDFLNYFFNDSGEWNAATKPQLWQLQEDDDQENLLQQLNKCLDKLPSLWFRVMNQKFIEEKESSEICKELNIASTNYWVIVHRAKLQLRDCIEKNSIRL